MPGRPSKIAVAPLVDLEAAREEDVGVASHLDHLHFGKLSTASATRFE